MSQNKLFKSEDIAEIAECLTLDEAKDLLAMNYKNYDSDLHTVSSAPIVVQSGFASVELQKKNNISSFKTRIESLEKAVYLLIRNNIDSAKLNYNRDNRFESILQELRDIKNDFVQGK